MRGGLVLVVVGLDVVAAHGMILKLVPHQDAAQVGVAVEDDAVEVEDLALLELGPAPDGVSEGRWTPVGAVRGAHAQDHGAVLQLHREEVVDGFEVAGLMCLRSPRRSLLPSARLRRLPSTSCLTLTFSLTSLSRPVDAGDVGAEVERSSASSRRNRATATACSGVDEQRVLRRWGWGSDDLDAGTGNCRFDRRLDFFQRLHRVLLPDRVPSCTATGSSGTVQTRVLRRLEVVRARLGHRELAGRLASRWRGPVAPVRAAARRFSSAAS